MTTMDCMPWSSYFGNVGETNVLFIRGASCMTLEEFVPVPIPAPSAPSIADDRIRCRLPHITTYGSSIKVSGLHAVGRLVFGPPADKILHRGTDPDAEINDVEINMRLPLDQAFAAATSACDELTLNGDSSRHDGFTNWTCLVGEY